LKKSTIDRRRTLPLVVGCVATLNPLKIDNQSATHLTISCRVRRHLESLKKSTINQRRTLPLVISHQSEGRGKNEEEHIHEGEKPGFYEKFCVEYEKYTQKPGF
ncbi:MAG: hypothetical protein HC941_27745, partial [Microcoleus sp. SU_5_3]|nr:hypothetical protein [Microcoleus sp. SU_5_3]